MAGWQGATRIAVGGDVTLAVMADGSIKGAGSNAGGNLGIGTTATTVSTPTALAAPTGAGDVSASYTQPSAMALVAGQLRYWGSSTRFASSPQLAPVAIAAPSTPLSALSVAGYHALAIGPGNAVYAWGNYEARGCGNFDSVNCADTRTPTLVTLP